jgi:uncharacterized damage-inducible protein DinB
MMSSEWLAASARYNRWMNDKLYALAATLSDETRKRDCGAFFKSIHGTFNHILVADRVWLGRFKGAMLPPGFLGPGGIRSIEQELYSDFEELRRERASTDEELYAWVTELTREQLAAPFEYLRLGQKQTSPLWWLVAHVFNHQTHHRGQAHAMISSTRVAPPPLDLIYFIYEDKEA